MKSHKIALAAVVAGSVLFLGLTSAILTFPGNEIRFSPEPAFAAGGDGEKNSKAVNEPDSQGAGEKRKSDIQSDKTPKELKWYHSFAEALAEAKSQNKLVFADVYTDWCGWCKRLDRDTFSDPGMVAYLSEKYICVKVNAENGKENIKLAEDAEVTGFPTGLVFKSGGELLGKVSGYKDAFGYKAALESLEQGNSEPGSAVSPDASR
ncbi:MAG: thioredoxin family protein [Candidatus Obscuribacter sp.]|nr:thioredoxin family protein [Candidatus Melainabacteria bacterium]MDX1989975.1 thioredoxin family protein [Candidatus Obscuribacter sp.]